MLSYEIDKIIIANAQKDQDKARELILEAEKMILR